MLEPLRFKSTIAVLVLGSVLLNSSPIEQLAYVRTGAVASLNTVPDAESELALGELYGGTAVLIDEERAGFAKVRITAWVPAETLSYQRPAAAPAAETPAVPKTPLVGVAHAAGAGLTAAVEQGKQGEILRVVANLQSRGKRPVKFAGALPAVLTIYDERLIAGGGVKGEKLASFEGNLAFPSTAFPLALEDLPATSHGLVILSLKVKLPERSVYGSLRDVDLTGETD